MEDKQTLIELDPESTPEWASPEVAAAEAGEQADFSKHLAPAESENNNDDS